MTATETTRATDPDAVAASLVKSEAHALADEPLRRPSATYRLQVHKGFRMDDASAIVDYLADLGISDAYFSPYLDARPGSTHGYDVSDHGRMNPEIGDEAAHRRLIETLRDRGMGRVLDIVPNHMGIGGPNRFWLDMLEVGPRPPRRGSSTSTGTPSRRNWKGASSCRSWRISMGKSSKTAGSNWCATGGRSPSSITRIGSRSRPSRMRSSWNVGATNWPGGSTPMTSTSRNTGASGPPRTTSRRRRPPIRAVEQVLREKDVLKRRLRRLCDESPALRAFLDENSPFSRAFPATPALSTPSTASWSARSIAWPTGESPPTRSTIAGSSTSTTWRASAPKTRPSSTRCTP